MAKDIGCSQKKASEILAVLLLAIEQALSENRRVSLRNFGKFSMTSRQPRRVNHPLTGRRIDIERRNIIKFKCSKVLEDTLNVFDWTDDDPFNTVILQQIYDLIEESEIEDIDEDEGMYYPGKVHR